MSSKVKNEADMIVESIKTHWPQFQVTRDNILKPNSDLAVRFYIEFISYCQEKLSLSVGSSLLLQESDADLDMEEKVFQAMSQMSDLFKKAGLTFLLEDVYAPTVLRNKHFFRICLHFMDYFELILDEVVSQTHEITAMKEDMEQMREQQNYIKLQTYESSLKMEELNNTIQKLTIDLESSKKLYDECIETNLQKDKQLVHGKKQIVTLKSEFQKIENEMLALEQQENDLEDQCLTETDYKNLLQELDKLENEIKLLSNDNTHMTDFLTQENDVLKHYEMCNRRIPDISDSKKNNIDQLIKLEDQLYDLKLTIETLMNTKLYPTKQFVLQKVKQLEDIMKNISEYQEQLDQLHEKIPKEKETLLDEVRRLKDDNAQKLFSIDIKISEHKENICKVSDMMNRLRNTFKKEYLRVSVHEEQTLSTFSAWLEEHAKSSQISSSTFTSH